ncbi:PAP2 superfamily protein [uncultured archaeon]|nr:PAP2 superfamily protein [uncultured archaeon]
MIQTLFQGTLPFEAAAGHFIQSFASQPLDYFFTGVTLLGNPALWFLLAAFFYWKGEEKRAMAIATVLLITSALVGFLKIFIGRPRPSLLEFRVISSESDVFSMPSGHAATIAGIFGYYWDKFRGGAKAIGMIAVLFVMVSRVYLGMHFIGDVIVGAAFGFVIGRALHHFEKDFEKISFSGKRLLEEIEIMAVICLAMVISFMFRPLALGSGLLGFFAGGVAFKLLGMDSQKISGNALWVKEAVGFAVLGATVLSGIMLGMEPEAYFLGGAWASLIYPALYEKITQGKIGQAKGIGTPRPGPAKKPAGKA